MLSFSINIGKELGFISPLGSDKSVAESAAGDMLGVLPDDVLTTDGNNEAESLLLGTRKKKLFKDIFSDVTKNITTKQHGEITTLADGMIDIPQGKGIGLTTDNDLTLHELLNIDFVAENTEFGLEENVISEEQNLEINDNNLTCLQDKVTANNEIKHFARKFSDNKITSEKANTIEQNIFADWEIAPRLNLQISEANNTTNSLNSEEKTLNKDAYIPIEIDIIITNNNSSDHYLQAQFADESNTASDIENKEINAIAKSTLNDTVNNIELDDNVSSVAQLPDLSIEYNNIPVVDKNILGAMPLNTGIVNETIIESVDNTEVSNYSPTYSLNDKEAYYAKNFNNKYSTNNHNYSNNKQISNNLNTNNINSTFDNNEVLTSDDLSNVAEVPSQNVMSVLTNKGKSNNDTELKVNHISNSSNINKIDNFNVTNSTPKQDNTSNIAPTINSNKIDNIKVVLSKLLNSTPDSTTFGDKNIMLTTHKNTPTKFSVNMDEALDIQSIEVSSETIETKQVSDWVKAMPASKVNYIAANESYNLLENVVNNIVDKFYADNIESKHNSVETNKLSFDNNVALKQISLKFDSQTASEYKLSTSSIINEIFAKIESAMPELPGDVSISLLNNELSNYSMQNIPKAVTLPVANSKPVFNTVYNDGILFNINEMPIVSKDSNLDIFIQEDNWEVLFDISDAGEHIIFQSDFKNTDILSNNEFSDVKLNIVSSAEEIANIVDTLPKSYTVKNYKESTDVVDNATQKTQNSSTAINDDVIFDDINMDANGNVYVEIKNRNVDNNTVEVNNSTTTKIADKTTNKVKSLPDVNKYIDDESIPAVEQYQLAEKEIEADSTTVYKNDNVPTKSSELKSNYVYTNEDISFEASIEDTIEVNDFATKKTQIKTTDKVENSFDVAKSANDSKNVVMQDNKTTYESIRNVMPNETAPVKLENNNTSNIPLNTFNLSGLASNNVESKQVAKNTKTIAKPIISKAVIDDAISIPKISLHNISLKSINNKDVSADNSYQPQYNQAVSSNSNAQQEQETVQLSEITMQPIANKENTIDTSIVQQDSNVLNVKMENNTQPTVSRTFINIKPNEIHRVVWHTTDNMLKEGSKVAAKSIKIVMNPQSLGDVVVEIKLQDNAANVSFKAKNIEALNEIEKNIGALKDMLISTDIKTTEFKYEKINTTNDSSRNFSEFNQQQSNQQQSKNNQQQARREFLNSVLNDNDSIKHDVALQNSFYKLVEEYV